jgi:hypothetical protein
MNRLERFIQESDDVKEFYKRRIERECSQIIILYKNRKKYLYRGLQKTTEDFGTKIPRQNRKPKDTSIGTHEMYDDAFEKRFGWRARSEGVFATASVDIARGYGKASIIFPTNGFKYIWSTSFDDLYTDAIQFHHDEVYNMVYQEMVDEYVRSVYYVGHWETYEYIETGRVEYNKPSDVPGYVSHTQDDEYPGEYNNRYAYVKINNGDVVKLIWNPDIDLTDYQESEFDQRSYDHYMMKEIEKTIKTYKDTGIGDVINRKAEIMIKCVKYHWISSRFSETVDTLILSD